MTPRKPAAAADFPRAAAVRRRFAALRAGTGWLGVVVLGAAAGVALASAISGGAVVGAIFGILLSAGAGIAVFTLCERTWMLVLTILFTILYGVAVAVTCVGYVAGHGERYTATVVSSECHRSRNGTTCTARFHRPDGSPLDEDVAVGSKLDPGETVNLVGDRAGIVATHPADEVDPEALPLDLALAGAGAAVLAVLFGTAGWMGVRHPDRPGRHRTPRRRTA